MMPELPVFPTLFLLAVLHCAIGLAATFIAQRKGFDRSRWLIWGLIGGTGALVMVLLMKGLKPTCSQKNVNS